MKRRKRKKTGNRHVNSRNSGKGKGADVIIVLAIAAFAGYLTATYLIVPLLGIDIKTGEEVNKEIEKPSLELQETEPAETEPEKSGYALQYGSFSTKEGADQCSAELSGSGITAEVIEKDGLYKVIGKSFDTEAEAEAYILQNPSSHEVYVTQLP